MFKDRRVNVIISIVVAILLWVYVVGQVNPTTKKNLSGIKVSFENEELLEDSGLALLDPGDITVSVTVEGKRADLNKIDSEDIVAKVDLYDLGKGKNTVSIDINTPESVSLVKSEPDKINITIEDRVSVEKDVKVDYIGKLDGGAEPGDVKKTPDKVVVSGAESAVKKVKHVSAKINVSDIKEKETIISAKAQAVDEEGNIVKHMRLSSSNIAVTISKLQLKEVPLSVETTGNISDKVELEKIDIPNKVTIKGTEEALKKIDSVSAETIDIEGVDKNMDIPINVILPDGVELAEKSEDISAEIKIKSLISKTFEISSADIRVNNLDSGYTAKVKSATVKVTVTGKETIMSAFTANNLNISIDLSGLKEGTHRVKVVADTAKKVSNVTISPGSVEIRISEE